MCACADLRRIARIDRAVLAALGPHLFRRVVAEDDVLGLDAERFEVRPPDGRRRVDVQHARDADLEAAAAFARGLARAAEGPAHGLLLDAAEHRRRHLDVVDHRAVFGHRLGRVEAAEEHLALVVHEVRVAQAQVLAARGELLERVGRFDRALLAAEAGDVAARAAVGRLGVDERARAVVRAEMAPRGLVVAADVLDVDRGVEADERRVAAPLHDAQRLERRADRPGFAWMRVHVDLGVRHALLDVVDLRLHAREVVLRAALQHVARAQRRHARNLHDVLPDVLRQHHREARRAALPCCSPPSGSSRGRCRGTPRSRS